MTSTTQYSFQENPASNYTISWLVTLFAGWAGLITLLAYWRVFDMPASEPSWPTIAAISLPVAIFAAAMLLSTGLRKQVLALDPVLLTALQAWRILGGVFVVVYAFGHLPAFFAFPAGLGDVAIGLTAPFLAWRLYRQPNLLISTKFRWFQYAGLIDFVVAVGVGTAARNSIPGLVGSVTTTQMELMPLVLIPTFVVPAFIILHLIVLMQIRAANTNT